MNNDSMSDTQLALKIIDDLNGTDNEASIFKLKISQFLKKSIQEAEQIGELINYKKNELNQLEKLYSIINKSTNVYKKLFKLSECSKCKTNNEKDFEEPEEIEIDKEFIKNIIDQEEITSTNQSMSEKDGLNETQKDADLNYDSNLNMENIITLNIPLEASNKTEHGKDPRCSKKNSKCNQLNLEVFKYNCETKESIILAVDSTLNQKSEQIKPLGFNLNLPSAISSILFKNQTNIDEMITTPQAKVGEHAIKHIERPKDPRTIKNSSITINKEKENSILLKSDKELKPDASNNPIFNRLQNILNSGFKNSNLSNNKKTTKHNYECVQKNGIVIRRKMSYPLDYIEQVKSQLVVLYENEPAQLASTTTCMLVNSKLKNKKLEKMINNRNKNKINELENVYKNCELFNEFSSRLDLIHNLNSLMNYDFCNNKYNKNKPKSNPRPKKIKIPKVEDGNRKPVSEIDTTEFFSLLEPIEENVNTDIQNNLDDDLYSDLVDYPDEVKGDTIENENLSEEGQIADDLPSIDCLNNQTNVLNENKNGNDDEQLNKKRKLSTSNIISLSKLKEGKNSKENNFNYNDKTIEIERSKDYKSSSTSSSSRRYSKSPSCRNRSSDRYRSSKTRSRSKSRPRTSEHSRIRDRSRTRDKSRARDRSRTRDRSRDRGRSKPSLSHSSHKDDKSYKYTGSYHDSSKVFKRKRSD